MSQSNYRRARSPRQTRAMLRVAHLLLAGVSGFALYSPTVSDSLQRVLLGYGVFPALTLTGLWIWQQARVRRLSTAVSRRLSGERGGQRSGHAVRPAGADGAAVALTDGRG
jgi:hypothetical protein